MTPVHDSFAIERVFHACPAHVFACWADPELKRQWFVDSDGLLNGRWGDVCAVAVGSTCSIVSTAATTSTTTGGNGKAKAEWCDK